MTSAIASRVFTRFLTSKSASIGLGETVEQGNVRIHRYRPSIVVWDLTNAGKRGAKVERLSIISSGQLTSQEEEKFIGNIAMMIDGLGSMKRIVGTLKDYLLDYPDDLKLTTSYERGVDVMPAGFHEIKIKTDHIELEVGYKDYVLRDRHDMSTEDGGGNDATCIPSAKGGIKGIPVFYRWVKDNETSIRHMQYRDVLEIMKKLGLAYHTYCALD